MKSDSSLARTLLHPAHHLQAVRQESAKQIGYPSPSWPISTLLFELLIERSFSPAWEVKVSEHFSLACGSWRSCSLSLAQSLHPSQCGHSPMQELRLSKQQSLGKFALAQDYVNYHGIITSLKQAEINYLWWNECKMRKYWWGQKKRGGGGERLLVKGNEVIVLHRVGPWEALRCNTTWQSKWAPLRGEWGPPSPSARAALPSPILSRVPAFPLQIASIINHAVCWF